jgi:hypothetical protein
MVTTIFQDKGKWEVGRCKDFAPFEYRTLRPIEVNT